VGPGENNPDEHACNDADDDPAQWIQRNIGHDLEMVGLNLIGFCRVGEVAPDSKIGIVPACADVAEFSVEAFCFADLFLHRHADNVFVVVPDFGDFHLRGAHAQHGLRNLRFESLPYEEANAPCHQEQEQEHQKAVVASIVSHFY